MSVVREDEKNKASSSGKAFGIAAAVGLGIGAVGALYYFLNKSSEQPHLQAGSSSNRREEIPGLLEKCNMCGISSDSDSSDSDSSDSDSSGSDSSSSDSSDSDSVNMSLMSVSSVSFVSSNDSDMEFDLSNDFSITNGSEVSSSGDDDDFVMVTRDSPVARVDNTMNMYKMQLFRNRSYTLEECSICVEVMLIEHKLQTLPCGHKFHKECVQAWLNDNPSCPNCRQPA